MGALREVLTAQYARLAQLLEDAIARLVQDTEVLFAILSSVLLRRSSGQDVRVHAEEQKPPGHSCSGMLLPTQPWALRRV